MIRRGRKGRTLALIERTARGVLEAIEEGRLPELAIPARSLANVVYDEVRGHFELGPKTKARSLGVRTARPFAQTLRLLALSRELVRDGDFATKREAYYVAKGWDDCRFDDQRASDAILDDIEALASRDGLSREALGFVPESHGGSVAGALTVFDDTPGLGPVEIDCTSLGSGAYTVPRSLEHLSFESDAEIVLAVETGGMFQRLSHHRFWERVPCVLLEMGGVPSRATRRFARKLVEDLGLPLYVFTDCDPYGFANIYRTLKAGSGNAAHMSHFYAVPSARFLGVTPQDIVDFGLEDAAQPLTETDVKRGRDALANDPFFRAHPAWVAAIEQLLELGIRAEQQALAKWGLNFVIEEYLPRKLAAPERFLP
ncbi:MAG TPA: DNA topoisomerase IV subunit A [Sandaracinaceae bacterium LLY-WYZ-13_1]|nr:DNA topoisomerase IV subunit A [Sandaracinaceae bacterium LLY-WYZ-13_1]